jgi:DNA-binding SARP family transcriptional activator
VADGQFSIVALERLNEARLSLGEHPLRETLWAQLMLALYRSGRQAEALKAYQRLREHLVEDLGIEPSRELVELEAAVLRHDSTLDIPMAPSATASSRRFANTASAS